MTLLDEPETAPNVPAPDEGTRRFSLRTRVTLLAAICVAGALILVSLGAYFTVSNNLYNQFDQNLRQRAANVLQSPQVLVRQQGITIPAGLLASFDVRLDVIDANGNSVVGIGKPERPPSMAGELAVADGTRPDYIDTDPHTDQRVLAVPYPTIPNTALVISQPLGPTRDALAKLAVVLLVIGGAGVIVAALAGTAVAQGGLRPVLRLTNATERIARTGELRPIPVTGDDELSRLTTSFNTMLGALAESQDRQRRLVADAGHELRTPLTSLRTNLELLIASERPGAPQLAENDRAEIHTDLRAQIDELTTLVGDLVELARDDGIPQEVREPVDLVEVVERALERAKRRAADVRFDVSLQPWVVFGDSSALQRAVLNLLDNAVKFSPQGGVVRVGLWPAGDGTAWLQVTDAGPGIADGDLPHVFDRFYRSSEARTLPGSGLGLAIVKQVVERHGGSVYAGAAQDGGAQLTLCLPGAQL